MTLPGCAVVLEAPQPPAVAGESLKVKVMAAPVQSQAAGQMTAEQRSSCFPPGCWSRCVYASTVALTGKLLLAPSTGGCT